LSFKGGDKGQHLKAIINPVPNLQPPTDNTHTGANMSPIISRYEWFGSRLVYVLGAGN